MLEIASIATLQSCESAKVAQQQRNDFLKMKGTWTLTSVDYAKNLKIQPFDENADISCFIGSTWNLIPNNFTGTYTLNGGSSCPSTVQPIKFEVLGGNLFRFKKIPNGTKAKLVTAGYEMNIKSMDENMMSLSQNVMVDGTSEEIVYNFSKNTLIK